jgi:molybdenum cofactor cytidylyltransferase
MIALVILAAGESQRMGTPKQLLTFGGKTLIRHSALVALESLCSPAIAVLGANQEKILPEIAHLTLNDKLLHILNNSEWQEGMASSIRLSINHLVEVMGKNLEAIVFMLCDQPFVNAELINELVTVYRRTRNPLVVSTYENGVNGVPALFSSAIFPELLQLKGDTGARKIIMQFSEKMLSVPFPKGNIDLDTPEAYQLLMNQYK